METQLITKLHGDFEDNAHMQDGVEFWYARELQSLLGYEKWENFDKIIAKAKQACKASKQELSDHFADVRKMVKLGSRAERSLADYKLTRYACYLIAQNGDPQKDEIAFAMTYFAVQTRKQEVFSSQILNQINSGICATSRHIYYLVMEKFYAT